MLAFLSEKIKFYFFFHTIVSHFFVVIVRVSDPTINLDPVIVNIFSTDMILPSQYIMVEIASRMNNLSPRIQYDPRMLLQSFAINIRSPNSIVPDDVTGFPFSVEMDQVPFIRAPRTVIFIGFFGDTHAHDVI